MSGVAEGALDQLQSALDKWTEQYGKIFDLLTTSPEDFQNGVIWEIVTNIVIILQGIGISLLIIFFFYGLIKSGMDYRDIFKNPKNVAFIFIRIFIAEFFVINSLDILLYILRIIQGIMSKIQTTTQSITFTIPENIKTALEQADWWASVGAWAASFVGSLIISLLSMIIIILVYGRFFKIFLLSAIAPIPLAGYASETTESIGNNFMKSYIGECLRGVVIVIACLIFSAFAVSPASSNATTAGAMVWDYVFDVSLQMLILVIMIKSSDRMVKEFFSL